MMKAYPRPKTQFHFELHALMSAGEAVGDAVFEWCERELGVVVNEMFGQTEINYIVGNCAMNNQRTDVGWPAKPGSMGKGYPGHVVDVIDDAGKRCGDEVIGEVAVLRQGHDGQNDPVFFLGYWNNPEATKKKYTGDWCRTGDLARRDADGYLWYAGRTDDMFKAAGYRIGPGEIENCLVRHPSVVNAAVVPKPDKARGATVKAFVVLSPDVAAQRATLEAQVRQDWDTVLTVELQSYVRGKLAPYEYPKDIEFVDALPMTTTGKVQRRVLRVLEEERAQQAGAGLK
jgi:acetyl-CoA synthetase